MKRTFFALFALSIFQFTCAMNQMHQIYQLKLGAKLRKAARSGNQKLVCRLLKFGAPVDGKSRFDHKTPLMIAIELDYKEICQILLEHKAQVDAKHVDGGTLLAYAAKWDLKDICQLLLKYNASVDAKDDAGYTPLMLAARYGCKDTCQLLLDHKASIYAKHERGYTSLNLAVFSNHKETWELLINAMLKQIKAKQASIVVFLGVKKFYSPACLNLIDRNIVLAIARLMHGEAAQEKQNLFAQIHAIGNKEIEQKIETYARQQLKKLK